MSLLNTFSFNEARAVHDNDQYELESDRFQQEQLPNWDDEDNDLINHNLPGSTLAPQVCLLVVPKQTKTYFHRLKF